MIADRIQEELLEQRLRPGDRLPTEQDLVERHGVSRSVIREAGRILDQRGLVDIRPGRGMVVAQPDGSKIAEQYSIMLGMSQASFAQLMETRLVVEVEIAGLAALRRTDEQVEEMRATVRAARAHQADFSLSLHQDLRFHELVSSASGNPFFALFIDPVNTCLRNSYTEERGYLASLESTLAEHEAIIAAISDGDCEAAKTASRVHLNRVLKEMSTLVSD